MTTPDHPVPGDGTFVCPICADSGVLATIGTPDWEFLIYCKCPAGQPQTPTPPTLDIVRE